MATDIPGLGKASLNALGMPGKALERMREELQILLGTRGDPLDAALTLRSAMERGLIDRIGDALSGNVTYVNTAPGYAPGAGPGGGTGAYEPDLTPPPMPTGLVVTAGFTQVLVEWNAPTYTQGRGNKQTNVYAVKKATTDNTLPTFAAGVTPRVSVAPGGLNVIALPSELNTRWHVWITFETVDGVESLAPAGGINGYNVAGVYPTTGQDVAQLLSVLTGQIRESQLFGALGARINLIDAADTVAGSVAERVKTSTTNLQAYANAAAGTAQANAQNYAQSYAYAKSDGEALAGSVTTLAVTTRAAVLAQPLESWTLNGHSIVDIGAAGKVGTKALRLIPLGGNYPQQQGYIALDRTKRYRTRVWARPSATSNGGLYFALRQFATDTGTVAGTNQGFHVYAINNVDRTTHEAAFGAQGWGQYTYVWGPADWHPDARFIRPAFLDNYLATSGHWDVQGVVLEEVTAEQELSASLQTESQARVALDGSVRTLYTVRTELSAGGRTVMGGFGLAGTATAGEGPRIDFGVRADRFYVGAPSDGSAPGHADLLPFIIQATPTTINGVAVPAGTYIADAFIRNGTISNAKIGNAAIDDAKVANLSAAKLTVGDGTVGGNLKSTVYQSGSGATPGNGWLLTPGGDLRASNVILWGTIYAAAGALGGNTIDATGMQSPGYTAGSTGWRLDTTGLVRAFASAGTRVLDMAATGTQPVLKIGSALELLANGDAYFGGRLAIGTVSANGSTTASASFPSLPNSAATYSTGPISFSPSASITGVGGNISAWVSCDIKAGAESTAVEAIRVFAYLYRNGTQVDSSEVFLRSCVFPDPTGATRVTGAEVTLLAPLEPLAGAQVFTIGFDVKFYNSSGAAITPGPTAFTSYLQVVARANLQEIKV